MKSQTQVVGILRLCCANPKNLTPPKIVISLGHEDQIVQECKKCGRRHYRLKVDPGVLGITLSG